MQNFKCAVEMAAEELGVKCEVDIDEFMKNPHNQKDEFAKYLFR